MHNLGMLFPPIPIDWIISTGYCHGSFEVAFVRFTQAPPFYDTSNILKSSRIIWLFFIYIMANIVRKNDPNDDSGKFLVLAQTWFDCMLHQFVRYSLYVTKMTFLRLQNYVLNIFFDLKLFVHQLQMF